MGAFIRSPVCVNCAGYLERRRNERALHAMEMYFHEEHIQPCDDYYPFYYYHQRHLPLPLRNRLKRHVGQLEQQVPFGIPAPDAGTQSVFVDRRTKDVNRNSSATPSADGELLKSLARRLEALEEFIAGSKKQQPTQSHSTDNAVRSHRHSNPNAFGFRQQAPLKTPMENTVFQAQKRPSLRLAPDHAATIIQSRFRAYLVRRSKTLGHLRDLALAKSTFKELKALFADIEYRRILRRDQDERLRFSEKALALLLKVDSIPGSNCMVREARRSISKQIVGLLDAVDNLESKRRRVRSKRAPKNQAEDMDAASQLRTGTADQVRDIEGACDADVPVARLWGSRDTCEHEAAAPFPAEDALEGPNENGGLGFGISCSTRHDGKRYDSKPPVFTLRSKGRGHSGKTWPLPPHLQREIVEVLAMMMMMSGFGFHFSSSPSFDCICCNQWGFQ